MPEQIKPTIGSYPDSQNPDTYNSGAVSPNLGLALGHMSRAVADNFVLLDREVGGPFSYSRLSGTPQLPVNNVGSPSNFFTEYDSVTGLFSMAHLDFTDLSGALALAQIPAGGDATTFLRGDGHCAPPAAGGGGGAPTVLTGVAPTVTAGQIGLGSTTAGTIGVNGGATGLTALPVGYLIINVGGTPMQVPYYNVA